MAFLSLPGIKVEGKLTKFDSTIKTSQIIKKPICHLWSKMNLSMK